MIVISIQIQNKTGIRCHHACMIIGEVEAFPGNRFLLEFPQGTSSLNSILDLLGLGLKFKDEAILKVSGPDERRAGKIIAKMLQDQYDCY